VSETTDRRIDQDVERSIRSTKSRTSEHFPLIAAGILMALIVIAAATAMWNLHARVERKTLDVLAKLSLVIAEQTSHSFQSVDMALNDVIRHIAAGPESQFQQDSLASSVMHQYLADRVGGLRQVANLILIDAKGNYVNSSQSWPVPAMSLADREQFRYCRDTDKPGLFVSEPVRNRLDGAWTLYLARRLDGADGKFLGVVQAAVRMKHFEDFYKTVALGDGGSIALLRHDGTMLARYPEAESMIGRIAGPGPGAIVPEPTAIWGEGLDGETRLIALNAVPDFPLSIAAALTREAVLGSWRHDATIMMVGTFGALVGMFALLIALARKMHSIRGSKALMAQQNLELARNQQLLLDAQRIGKLGHWSADTRGNNAICSPQLFEIAGVPSVPLVSAETMISWIHPDDVSDYIRTATQARGRRFTHEHRLLRPDETIRWVRLESDPKFGSDSEVIGLFGIVQDITERKEAECAAEESKNLLFDAVESITQGFALYDSEDRFVLSNSRYREMFPELSRLSRPGMRYEDILRAGFEQDQFNEPGESLEAWLARTIAWRHAASQPYEWQNKDGRWIQCVNHRTSDGGIASVRTDITEFKRVQAKLEQKLEDLEKTRGELEKTGAQLLEAQRIGKLGHWEADARRETAIWSPQMFEIAGIPEKESVSLEEFVALLHPEDASRFLEGRVRSLAVAGGSSLEARLIRPDGELRWIRMQSDPQREANAKPGRIFGVVLDITEQKVAEDKATRLQRRLMDAIESFGQGFALWDKDDRFVLANSRFKEMFPGIGEFLLPGTPYEDILQAKYRNGLISCDDDCDSWVSRTLAWHRVASEPAEQQLKDGRWVRMVEHRTSDGGTTGLRIDVTDFKRVEGALEQRVADLERMKTYLEGQTLELVEASEALRTAKEAAEAANRAKSDFLAIMSHEIRTPLSGMVGMIDLLRETPLNQEQQRFTKLAKESSDNLLSVINDILDFSKLEAGRLAAEKIDFDVTHLINGVQSLFGAKVGDKGLDLTVSLAPDLPQWLKGDPNRIRQILLNLVNNAIKFTDRGRVGVRASHRRLGDGSVELRIEVTDSGIGMRAETQAQLFNPFVQADTSISRKYGGSGLGLAICKQLCAMMNGSIGVDSTSGEGSTFWFTVQCAPGAPSMVESPALVPEGGRSLRILVAEDSPIIATLISGLLAKQGFSKPDMVVNGKEAVAAVSRKSYDVVLMDVQMPEMDGMSATRAIRNLAGPERTVPIIALTANALVGQRENYLAAGMNDYVTKPIKPATLVAAINRWCARSGSDAANDILAAGE
jgi:PAS domain S-box-containing protein